MTIVLYALAILTGIAVWFAPITLHPHSEASSSLSSLTVVKVTLSVSISYTLLHVITVGLFFSGLKNFKTELRRPYTILCAGLITIALAQLQAPLALMLGAFWWYESGLILLLYILPNILIYAGIRLFARLVGIQSRWASFRYVLPVVTAIGVGTMLLPVQLSSTAPTDTAAHSFLALSTWQMCMNIACAYLAWRMIHAMGTTYTDAVRWLFYTMSAYALMSLHFVILPYIGYDTSWYGRTGAYLVVFVALGTMFVAAGYKFWQIGERKAVVHNASPLDVIAYVAGLVTNMREIDLILEDLRVMTANHPDGQPFSAAEQTVLIKVYAGLETYLVEREPLRKFTREELRQHISVQFPGYKLEDTFWHDRKAANEPTQAAA